MTQEMDLEGNHKLDWFFNEYCMERSSRPTNLTLLSKRLRTARSF